MDFFNIGDTIGYSKYNALVYMLRKFKRLTSNLKLGQSTITSDYGTYNILGGLISIEGNWILEDDVQIISNDCLLNCNYAFTFTVVDVNTSGTVNKREITFTGNTGDTGELNINIPEDSISSDEQILSDFRVDIVFDIHEYYTSPVTINVDLTVDKQYIFDGESATVTATITDDNENPIPDFTVVFKVNNEIFSETTDNEGIATLTITGTGGKGLIQVRVLDKEINIIDPYFYDTCGQQGNRNWWNQTGLWQVTYTQETTKISFDKGDTYYAPSNTPSLADNPEGIALEFDTPYCVEFDAKPIGMYINLFDIFLNKIYFNIDLLSPSWRHYKLMVYSDRIEFWMGSILHKEIINVDKDTVVAFSTDNMGGSLEFKNFIIYNIGEPEPPVHDYALSVTGDSIIQTGDTASVVATLTDNGVAVAGETLSYEIKKGSTVLDSGSDTTDANGQITIAYTGTGVGDVDVIVSFGISLQETFVVEDYYFYDTLTSDKNLFSITSGDATLTYSNDGLKMTGTSNSDSIAPLSTQLPSGSYSVEFDVTDATATNVSGRYTTGICVEDTVMIDNYGDGIYARKISTSGDFFDSHIHYLPPCHMKIEVTGSSTKTVKYYKDTTYLGQGTNITQNREFKFRSYNNRMIQIKNLKIKAL